MTSFWRYNDKDLMSFKRHLVAWEILDMDCKFLDYGANSTATMSKKKAKITVVGDGFVGKTCLLVAYTRGVFPQEEYIPTVFENYAEEKVIDGEQYSLSLWDTAGQEDYERLRPLSYPNTTCFLLCYSINNKDSYDNIRTKWAPEVRHHMPHTPFILVGTKNDLRDVDDPNIQLVSAKEGKKLARQIRAESYLECSAQRLIGLDEIITEAVRANTMGKKTAKITVVGDGAVGKTCLLLAYTKGVFPQGKYIPTVFDNYTEDKVIDSEQYRLSLFDTAGQDDYELLRPLSYPNTTCFLLCYSINSKTSYDNIRTKWAPEVRHHMPHAPLILVGTKSDLRDVDDPNIQLVSATKGENLARQIRAESYLECSAQRLIGLDEIITEAVRARMKKPEEIKKQNPNCVLV
ncbi:putative tumor susceptibility [Trypoxylus dichotomus]